MVVTVKANDRTVFLRVPRWYRENIEKFCEKRGYLLLSVKHYQAGAET